MYVWFFNYQDRFKNLELGIQIPNITSSYTSGIFYSYFSHILSLVTTVSIGVNWFKPVSTGFNCFNCFNCVLTLQCSCSVPTVFLQYSCCVSTVLTFFNWFKPVSAGFNYFYCINCFNWFNWSQLFKLFLLISTDSTVLTVSTIYPDSHILHD